MMSGLAGLLQPRRFASAIDLIPTSKRGVAEVRSGLGGTYVGIGALALVSGAAAAEAAVGATWLGAGAARVISIAVDRPETNWSFWAYLALEVGLGSGALLSAARRFERTLGRRPGDVRGQPLPRPAGRISADVSCPGGFRGVNGSRPYISDIWDVANDALYGTGGGSIVPNEPTGSATEVALRASLRAMPSARRRCDDVARRGQSALKMTNNPATQPMDADLTWDAGREAAVLMAGILAGSADFLNPSSDCVPCPDGPTPPPTIKSWVVRTGLRS